MTARHRLLITILSVMLAAPLFAATPREVVDRIATIIDNNYFDATRAHRIAEDLRTASLAGRFDAFTDPRDLEAKLTERLHPSDHHFYVTWSPPTRAGAPAISTDALERRTGYGFRRVEMLPGALGYVEMSSFADFSFDKPDEPARKAANAALELVSSADAIIIDLRNNPGGSPAMVGYLVSAFTAPAADIYNVFHHRDSTESERPKQSYANPRLDVPLYVLISGRTASAAESTAYTLQAAKRAVIVGEASGGASNPGGEFPAGDGFFVFVSTSTAINPLTGTNWESVGVKPDVTVAPRDALERAEILALETVLAKRPAADTVQNLETRWVLEALRAKQSPPSGPPLSDYVGSYDGATIAPSNGRLTLQRGRRPPWPLLRLEGDTFFVKDEPFRRVMFERDAAHQVSRFQLVRVGGGRNWFPRTHAPLSSRSQ
jgi:hypothetical protein